MSGDCSHGGHAAGVAGILPDMTDCVFCGVVAGVVAAQVVWSDDHAMAFLDRSPVFKGHVLVVPRAHIVTLPDLPEADVGPFFSAVRRVAAAVPSALDAHGTFVAINNVVSQSVPHLHAHVVPRRRKDGLRGFFWPRVRYADESDAATHASLLRDALSTMS
jgi:histidine triad (HIT) family protein